MLRVYIIEDFKDILVIFMSLFSIVILKTLNIIKLIVIFKIIYHHVIFIIN